MQEKVKDTRKFETEQKSLIGPFTDFIKSAVEEECKRKVSEYEQWSAKNVQPDYEEHKSFKAEIGVKPMVDFVEETPQIIDKVKVLSSNPVPRF